MDFRIKPLWAIVLAALFAFGCVRAVPGVAGSDDKIRVLISKGVKDLDVKGATGGPYEVTRGPQGAVSVNGEKTILPIKLKPSSSSGLIHINGKPFRGTVEVHGAKEGLLVVNELSLELYLVGIINNEISSKWPENVVKAQAVIARTYAIFNKNKRAKEPYHIEGTVMGQVYSGAGAEDQAALKAVRGTTGEILVYDGEPALTVYHSNAGGRTEASFEVWSRDYPYLKSVKSPYDENAPKFYWEFSIPSGEMRGLLGRAGHSIGEPSEIYAESQTSAGRVKTIVIKDGDGGVVRLSGEDLRKALGYSNIKSTIFEVKRSGEDFVFRGKGSGHGVGLSQWGAKGMAEDGYSYKEILRHYYPGTRLVRAY